MPVYNVQARSRKGEVLEVSLEAKDKQDLFQQLARKHLTAMDIKQAFWAGRFIRPKSGVTQSQVRELFFQLGTYLESGLPLEKLLARQSKQEKSPKLRKLLDELHKGIRSGKRFADVLGEQGGCFSQAQIAAIQAAEAGGRLGPTLLEQAESLEKRQVLQQNLISSLTYPFILLLTGFACVGLIIIFAVPRFARIFSDMGREMPFLLNILSKLGEHAGLTALGAIFLILFPVVGFIIIYNNPSFRKRLDKALLSLPLLSGLIVHYQLGMFFRTLGTTLQSGLVLDKALSLALEILTNTCLRQVFVQAQTKIRKGGRLSSSLETQAWMPDCVPSLIGVAEQSGTLDQICIKLAVMLEQELNKRLKQFLGLLEPLLILGVSTIIGGVVISLLYSLFSINF